MRAKIGLKVKAGQSLKNIRKPQFTWNKIDNARLYQVIIQGSIVSVDEKATSYQPPTELNFGNYGAYINVVLNNDQTCPGETVKFRVGIGKPIAREPSGKLKTARPVFKFKGTRGATDYYLVVDGGIIAHIRSPKGIHAKMMEEPPPTFTWQPKKGQGFSPGKHKWVVVARTEVPARGVFQSTASATKYFEVTSRAKVQRPCRVYIGFKAKFNLKANAELKATLGRFGVNLNAHLAVKASVRIGMCLIRGKSNTKKAASGRSQRSKTKRASRSSRRSRTKKASKRSRSSRKSKTKRR